MENPFTTAFGIEPVLNLSRIVQTGIIMEDFNRERPANQAYVITGVRGSGKTVALTSLAKYFSGKEEWIVLELNPSSNLLESLAAKLYSTAKIHSLFSLSEFNFSLLGIGASITTGIPVTDMETAIEEMLKKVKRIGRRVLITMDEVTNHPKMREFIHAFQIFIRHEHPLFLIMTGLYESVYRLQNDKALTFLYRAPKIELKFLSLAEVAHSYAEVFQLSEKEASEMAKMTRGYPYAFQILGYLRWESPDRTLEALIPDYDQYLENYVYEKIWSELPGKEKEIVIAIASHHTRVVEIREDLKMQPNELSVYRKRLARRGIVDIGTYGYMFLTLPRFGEIIQLLEME